MWKSSCVNVAVIGGDSLFNVAVYFPASIPRCRNFNHQSTVSGLTGRRMPVVVVTLHSPCRHKMGVVGQHRIM
nr:MAG TPA: hypothetical protein [Bacteriophage sp.]